MDTSKIKIVRTGAQAVYHGAKGVEKLSKLDTQDTGATRVKKIANAIKHLCKGLEKGLKIKG